MINSVTVPVKIINGEEWFSLMTIAPRAKVRAISMDRKPKRVQDEGKHHCFEIDVEGNIRIKPRGWKKEI